MVAAASGAHVIAFEPQINLRSKYSLSMSFVNNGLHHQRYYWLGESIKSSL